MMVETGSADALPVSRFLAAGGFPLSDIFEVQTGKRIVGGHMERLTA